MAASISKQDTQKLTFRLEGESLSINFIPASLPLLRHYNGGLFHDKSGGVFMNFDADACVLIVCEGKVPHHMPSIMKINIRMSYDGKIRFHLLFPTRPGIRHTPCLRFERAGRGRVV